MAFNFPEMWLTRVITLLLATNVAPWLEGIPELDVDVIELGAGSAGEQNIIHVPVETFAPEVLLNNDSYPIEVETFDDGTANITLDKYQTKATSLTDDQLIGASYNKIDSATRGHVNQINSVKYRKAIHAIAPFENTQKTPVIKLSDYSLDVYKAILGLKAKFDDLEVPMEGRRLVLCSGHYNQLLADRERFGDLLKNINTGTVAPMIAGFEVYQYVGNPTYKSNYKKQGFRAVPESGDMPASVAFYVPNIAKKTGLTKQYFQDAAQDPKNQQNLLNYRHYFIATPVKAEALGAIVGTAGVPVEGVSIVSPDSPLSLGIGQTETIELAFVPAAASNQQVVYSSDHDEFATVSPAGVITGIATGSATITVTTVDGNQTATLTVNVSE